MPIDKQVIGVKWIYRTKLNPDSSVNKLKAKMVVKGYSLQPRVDFNETLLMWQDMTLSEC